MSLVHHPYIAHQIWLHTSLLMQQSGRCGRNGQQSVSYLFYSRVELKKAGRSITEFVECSENCHRRILLSALGSPEERQPARILCCDSCTPGELPAKLNIIPLPSVNIGNQQSVRVRTVPKRVRDELYEALVTAREQVVTTNSGLRMLGPQVVCSDRVIHNLCKKAGRIQSVDDLKNFKGLRTDLYDLFFSVISEIVSRPRYGRQRM